MKHIALIGLVLLLAEGCSHGPFRVVMSGDIKTRTPPDNCASPVSARTLRGSAQQGPAVAVIDIDGLLVNQNLRGFSSMGENPVALFREKLDAASTDPGIRAVVLRINSPGGGVTATDIMRRDLVRFKNQRGVPIVACLMDIGAGGAYYIATAADLIVAHPTSVTGGIGVILNLYDLVETMGQVNAFDNAIRAGQHINDAIFNG